MQTHARPAGRQGVQEPKLHRALLERGIYWAPSAFEVGFLSLAHSEKLLRDAATQVLNAFDEQAGA